MSDVKVEVDFKKRIACFENSTALFQKKFLLWFCISLVPLCVMFDCPKG